MAAPDPNHFAALLQGKSPSEFARTHAEGVVPFDVKIISRLIGDDKLPPTDMPMSIPRPMQTKEEILVHSFFDSCAFKSGASCVVGKIYYHYC